MLQSMVDKCTRSVLSFPLHFVLLQRHTSRCQSHSYQALIASSCSAWPLASAGSSPAFAGPMSCTPSLLNRLPCTGQSQLFSAGFQHTTPFKWGQRALSLCTWPPSSLYTASSLLPVGLRTPPSPSGQNPRN